MYICKLCNEEITNPTCTLVQALPMKLAPEYMAPAIALTEDDKDNYFQDMYYHNDCWVLAQNDYKQKKINKEK